MIIIYAAFSVRPGLGGQLARKLKSDASRLSAYAASYASCNSPGRLASWAASFPVPVASFNTHKEYS